MVSGTGLCDPLGTALQSIPLVSPVGLFDPPGAELEVWGEGVVPAASGLSNFRGETYSLVGAGTSVESEVAG